jgi:methyl-accepting chemotaxis protein
MLADYTARIGSRFRDLPIRRKLMVVTMLTTAVALMLSGLGIVAADSVLFQGYLERDLSALAHIIGDNSTAALAFDDPGSAVETLGALRARPHVAAAYIYRKDGTTLAHYMRAGSDQQFPAPSASSTERDQIRAAGANLNVFHAVLLKGQPIGTLVLVYDLGELYQRMRLNSAIVGAVLLAASFIGFLLSKRLRVLIASPISDLAETARTVAEAKDYGIRATKASGDELGVLVDAFNEMLDGIQSRETNLRRALQEREEALREAQNARDSLATTLASIGDAVISTDVSGRIAGGKTR